MTRVAELSGDELEAWIAKALSDPPGTAYLNRWPGFDHVLERHAIQVAPMAGKSWAWCAVVVGRPGGLPAGPWQEGQSPRVAVGRALVAARYGREIQTG